MMSFLAPAWRAIFAASEAVECPLRRAFSAWSSA